MSFASLTIAALMFGTLTVVSIALMIHVLRMRERLQGAAAALDSLQKRARAQEAELGEQVSTREQLERENQRLAEDNEQKSRWLSSQEQEAAWLRAELEHRPRITRKTYKILTLGVKYTGKTSLTLKWANPLVDLGALKGTKIERYERTVSQVLASDVMVEHVFEIHDWGGEHIVDAQQELVTDEIHGVLLVVDLAGKDSKGLDQARIEQQLRTFQPDALQFFFGPRTVACCKTVVLFINKSDVLSGTPAEVEKEAMGYYRKLIDELDRYKSHVDVRVLVGSASYGHGTHHLFAHFVEKILPKSAYDAQLLQRMKAEAEPPKPPSLRANGKPVKPVEGAHHGK